MSLNSSVNSTDSDVFYVEQLSDQPSPRRNNTPDILNSTARTNHQAMRMLSVSTIASPQPHFVTIDDDSNQITIPYGFGQQHPIVPPSLNDLNLPPNPFNILATMAIANNTGDDNNAYSPESPDPSLSSSISSPPMSVSAFHSFETTHSTTDDNTFYYSSDNDPRRIYWETSLNETFESNEPRRVYPIESPPSTPPPPPFPRKTALTIEKYRYRFFILSLTLLTRQRTHPLVPKNTYKCLLMFEARRHKQNRGK